MRITHISPEFNYNNVNGTLSMSEKKSYFASKLMKFTDTISILNENIVYYENSLNEQLDFSVEKLLSPVVYNTTDSKNKYAVVIDDTQSSYQKDNNTSWILYIDLKELLIGYLFATLKSYRSFEGIKNNMTLYNNVDSSINSYITKNLLSRYQFDHIDLFISYNDLSNGGLRYQNIWLPSIEGNSNIVKNVTSKTDLINLNTTIKFNQEKSSSDYNFNYYYNVYFVKL